MLDGDALVGDLGSLPVVNLVEVSLKLDGKIERKHKSYWNMCGLVRQQPT